MTEPQTFEFHERIKPKKFEDVMPQWEHLLAYLQIDDLNTDSVSEINMVAVNNSNEEELAATLDDLYRNISSLESDDDKKAGIMAHEPLRVMLNVARLMVNTTE